MEVLSPYLFLPSSSNCKSFRLVRLLRFKTVSGTAPVLLEVACYQAHELLVPSFDIIKKTLKIIIIWRIEPFDLELRCLTGLLPLSSFITAKNVIFYAVSFLRFANGFMITNQDRHFLYHGSIYTFHDSPHYIEIDAFYD